MAIFWSHPPKCLRMKRESSCSQLTVFTLDNPSMCISLVVLIVFGGRISHGLCYAGLPASLWAHPASTSLGLGLQECTTMPSSYKHIYCMALQTQVLMLASKHFPNEAISLSNSLPSQSVLHVLQTYSQDICTVATELSWRHPRQKSSSVVLGMKFTTIHYHLVQYLRETTYKESQSMVAYTACWSTVHQGWKAKECLLKWKKKKGERKDPSSNICFKCILPNT